MMEYAMITGAGKGLGKAFANQCAKKGFNLILLALPGENINALARDLSLTYKIDAKVFELDMTDEQRLNEVIETINQQYKVFFLINNAGIGGTAAIAETSFNNMNKIISLNVKATVQVTTGILSNLLMAQQSYILNVASMAAFTPIAYKTVYPASKAFIASFSLGLKEELKEKGVNVSIVYPGPIMTNCNTSGRILAQGIIARMGLVNTDTIALKAIEKCMQKKAKIVPGLWNIISAKLLQWLPSNTSLQLVSSSVKRELQFNF